MIQKLISVAKEDHTLTQAATVFKINISTIIAWKRRYEATGNLKTQIRCPVNKKIIPEKHDMFNNIKHVYEL